MKEHDRDLLAADFIPDKDSLVKIKNQDHYQNSDFSVFKVFSFEADEDGSYHAEFSKLKNVDSVFLVIKGRPKAIVTLTGRTGINQRLRLKKKALLFDASFGYFFIDRERIEKA